MTEEREELKKKREKSKESWKSNRSLRKKRSQRRKIVPPHQARKRNLLDVMNLLPKVKTYHNADFAGIMNLLLRILFFKFVNAEVESNTFTLTASRAGSRQKNTDMWQHTIQASTGDSSNVRFANQHFHMCSEMLEGATLW